MDWINSLMAYSCDVVHGFLDSLQPLAVDPVSTGILQFFHFFFEICTGGVMY